jgi:hypothetical protein
LLLLQDVVELPIKLLGMLQHLELLLLQDVVKLMKQLLAMLLLQLILHVNLYSPPFSTANW